MFVKTCLQVIPINHFSLMAKAWPHPIKAVIFDNDGTILDTVKCYIEVDAIMCGVEEFPEDLISQVNGRNEVQECEFFIEKYHLNMTPDEFKTKREPKLHELLRQADTVPGVEDVIKKIHAMKIPMAVATSSGRELFTIKSMRHQNLFSLFKAIVCGDEVTEAKPSPEIFLTAARKLGELSPENVLVFEDATNGVKAANRAGYPVVMLTRTEGANVVDSLKQADAHATLLIDKFEDFNIDAFTWEAK